MYKLEFIEDGSVPAGYKIYPSFTEQEVDMIDDEFPSLSRHIIRYKTLVPINRQDSTYLLPVITQSSKDIVDWREFPKEIKKEAKSHFKDTCEKVKKDFVIPNDLSYEDINCYFKLYKYID